MAAAAGADAALRAAITGANTALEALQLCQAAGVALGDLVADGARRTAEDVLRGAPVAVDVIVIDRGGTIVGRAGP